jgi:hypothetical protein
MLIKPLKLSGMKWEILDNKEGLEHLEGEDSCNNNKIKDMDLEIMIRKIKDMDKVKFFFNSFYRFQ